MKPLSKKECVAAAKAIFQARVIVERHRAMPHGNIDEKLHELELDYWRHADATTPTPKKAKSRKAPTHE